MVAIATIVGASVGFGVKLFMNGLQKQPLSRGARVGGAARPGGGGARQWPATLRVAPGLGRPPAGLRGTRIRGMLGLLPPCAPRT